MLTESFLRKLDALSLVMRENARGSAGGMRRSKALGSSQEFSDFRSYAPGDDLRRIDWNAFARFDKLFLKLFLDEQETTLRVLLDASASMRHGEPDKWMLSVQLVETLSYLALCRYDRVAVTALTGGAASTSRTFGGRQAFPEVQAFLSSIEPGGQTALDASLVRVPIGSGRGVCALISDLLTESDWQRGLRSLLYRRQEVAVLHLLSPEELSPDVSGALRLIDAEGLPPLEVHATAETLRRYQRALEAFLKGAEKFCRGISVPYLRFHSDMDLEQGALKSLVEGGLVGAR